MAKKEEGLIMEHFDDLVVKNNHKVLSPLEVKEGMNIYNLFKEHPFKIHNRWLVLEIDDASPASPNFSPRAFCVLLYGWRLTPGTSRWIELSTLKRNEWRMF